MATHPHVWQQSLLLFNILRLVVVPCFWQCGKSEPEWYLVEKNIPLAHFEIQFRSAREA